MKKNTKSWYLLKLDHELKGPVDITVTPDKLVTSEQALLLVKSFYN